MGLAGPATKHAWILAGAAIAIAAGWAYWTEARPPFQPMAYRGSQVEFVEDMSAMCGPSKTLPTGSMSVTVDYYDVTAAGRVFQLVQYRHENCAAEGCPSRVFIVNPDGSRGLIVNAAMPLIDRNVTAQDRRPSHVSRDGRTFQLGERSFALTWN
jgi:hypothetical protein